MIICTIVHKKLYKSGKKTLMEIVYMKRIIFRNVAYFEYLRKCVFRTNKENVADSKKQFFYRVF